MTTYDTEYSDFESEFDSESEEGEEFLGGLLSSILGGAQETELDDVTEMELASELLEVSDDEELDEFLGKIFKKVGGFLKSKTGRALTGALKGVVKKALPAVGGALGSFVAPGVGTAVGSKLGSLASRLFEMEGELESMEQDEAEFEVARRLVRLSAAAAKQAANAPDGMPPTKVAQTAVISAAKTHAPGLLRGTPQGRGGGRRRSKQGTWRRQGRTIVLTGV